MVRKEELVKEIKGLIKSDDILEIRSKIDEHLNEYDAIFNQEKSMKLAEFVSDGDKPEFFTMPLDDYDNAIEAYRIQYKEKLKNAIESKKAAEKKNLEIKLLLINELKELVEVEDQIGIAYERFNDVKERWLKVGNISQNQVKEIQHQFRTLTEEFYYKIQIYKELKKNDLKKNFEQKKDLINRLKSLLNEEDIKELETLMRALLVEWDNIGPTFKGNWEEIKTEFYGTYHKLNDKIRLYYKKIKEEQKENLNKKRALIGKAKELLEIEADNVKHWKDLTAKIKEYQEEWKVIGFVPAVQSQKVWNEFRSVGNELFAQKKVFFGKLKDQKKTIAALKKGLIEKAVLLIENIKKTEKIDWGIQTKKIIALQKEWKEAGSASRQNDQKLWEKFRTVCDQFFELKDKKNASEKKEQITNLKAKKNVIGQLGELNPKMDKNTSIKKIEELSKKFHAIGFVPFKSKEALEKSFTKAVEKAYGNIGVSKSEKQNLLFEERINQLKSGNNSIKSLEFERRNLNQQVTKAKEQELKLSNNLAFFTGNDSNPLIKKAKSDYAQAVAIREQVEAKIKQLNIEIHAAKKAEDAKVTNTNEVSTVENKC